MQSDDRMAGVLEALRAPREAFDAALAAAVEELRVFIDEESAPLSDHAAHEAARLGAFASGRIDVDRFSALVSRTAGVSPAALERIRRIHDLLVAFRGQGDALYHVRVERGGDLRDTVRDALAARGRLFNAARHVELIRAGGDIRESDDALCFSRWHRSERLLAPPLIVDVEGADVIADGLAEYLDGAVKIVLLVSGPAPAAPLARLIAPHTFVMQTTDPTAVVRLAAYGGAGIAAVLAEGSALFTHDPARGARLSQRLTVELLMDDSARAVGRYHVRRQQEEVAWLRELAQFADATRTQAEVPVEPDAEPVDQLAGWLLRSAHIDASGAA